MNHKSELDNSIANIRQEVIAEWYQEWQSPQDTLGTVSFQEVLKPLTHLPSMIRNLLHPIGNEELTAAPPSNIETESAL